MSQNAKFHIKLAVFIAALYIGLFLIAAFAHI